MGAVRAASQMVSYEVAMGYSCIIDDDWYVEFERIAAQQSGMHWNVFTNPFLLFFNLCICRNK
jgi:NADH-quinone oxidoreductase subunit H